MTRACDVTYNDNANLNSTAISVLSILFVSYCLLSFRETAFKQLQAFENVGAHKKFRPFRAHKIKKIHINIPLT